VCKRPANAESRIGVSPPEDEIGDGRKLDEADSVLMGELALTNVGANP
jgi:hypothetical protein